jgi:hypothetical protein
MTIIDLKQEMKCLYQASTKTVVQIDVPALNFLMVDGMGDPNTSPDYIQAVEALFSVSYAAKFMVKKGPQLLDYAVMQLEGLWWADNMAAFASGDKSQWQWTMMIMQPDFVSWETINRAMTETQKKKNLPAIDRLRLERFHEGPCAQLLHVGPFSEEGPSIERLHAFIDATSSRTGRHHEIYLSDIRKAAPSKWKTIIRQPMHSAMGTSC